MYKKKILSCSLCINNFILKYTMRPIRFCLAGHSLPNPAFKNNYTKKKSNYKMNCQKADMLKKYFVLFLLLTLNDTASFSKTESVSLEKVCTDLYDLQRFGSSLKVTFLDALFDEKISLCAFFNCNIKIFLKNLKITLFLTVT